MLKFRKFNINIFLSIFEVRAKEPFADNGVKIEETERQKKVQVHSRMRTYFLKLGSC